MRNGQQIPVSSTSSKPVAGWRFLFACLLPVALLLTGCASSNKAPVYDRSSHGHYKREQVTRYKVVKGDTLFAVAWKAGVDYRTLARWNKLRSPYTIYPGQVLRLTAPKTTKASSTKKKTSAPVKRKSTSKRSKTTVSNQSRSTKTGKSKPVAKGSLQWSWPTRGSVISKFAKNDSARKGIRISGQKGQKVFAAEAGKVVYVGSGLIGYGRLIIVKHNDKYLSAYAHNNKLRVKEGDQVAKGEHIADMGAANTGQAMLHFEIRRYGKPVDPLTLLPR